jgi:hypothetical protein
MGKNILVAVLALGAGCGGSKGAMTMPTVPDALKPEANASLAVRAQATGVQIYECKPGKDDATKYEWTLKAPEAELFDESGKKIGKHYAGPTWEAEDGSKVVGEAKARDPGPDAGAIPWLLLGAKSTSGTGIFGQITTIQRLNTQGGKAPAEGCSQAQAGAETRVPYRALYLFYVAKP